METEYILVNNKRIPHCIFPIKRDGNCLFSAISYFIYGYAELFAEVREEIVEYVSLNWNVNIQIMSAKPNGDNYDTVDEYVTDMSKNGMFGTFCEIIAATELYSCKIEVYQNGILYCEHGESSEHLLRLKFGGKSNWDGHFDVMIPVSLPDDTDFNSSNSLNVNENNRNTFKVSSKKRNPSLGFLDNTNISLTDYNNSNKANIPPVKKKRRARVTTNVRKANNKTAVTTYREKNPEIIRKAVKNYSKKKPEVNKEAVKKYTKKKPEVNKEAVKKYTKKKPEVNREAVKKYTKKKPEVNREAVKKYTKKKPEVNTEAVKQYTKKKPEVHREAVKQYTKKNPEVNRNAAAQYAKKKPEIHRKAVNQYALNNPDIISTANQISNEKRKEDNKLKKKTECFSGFEYDPEIDYATNDFISIGMMCHKCKNCNALKWLNEPPGMCCKQGKVQIPLLQKPPEPLLSLLVGSHSESKNFLKKIRKYNSCFQMTSFGAKQIKEKGFMPTFKVQGQVYHRMGSLFPEPEKDPVYLQIYFVGDEMKERDLRCNICSDVNKDLVYLLQKMLHETNQYVKDFKAAIHSVPEDEDFKVVIRADKKPSNAHRSLYNEPSVKEVAAVIVGELFEPRDIVIYKKNEKIMNISEFNKSYDTLQYPLMFCYGEHGYCMDIPKINPITKQPMKKTVSCLQFYSFRLMIRDGEVNYLFYYQNLMNQFLVDIYAKIEAERLGYVKRNQKELRVEKYTHLQDAINKEHLSLADIGKTTVLPSTYIGGPRWWFERAQDALVYSRIYGTADLFITFTCNPKWADISKNLLDNQEPLNRHDLIARVFNLKVNKMVSMIKGGEMFGPVKCYVYTIEWQKRGLPHLHLLVWLEKTIQPNDIDKIISAEIPNPDTDPKLYDIIKSNMIHGPCGVLNPNSPCMVNGKCSKRFPKPLNKETQTGDDGYPQYRRRSTQDGGFTVNIKGMELDNRWVVPYNPVLSRCFEAHINVEYCCSIKSIKYICKYINKGSDQAAFTITDNKYDEVKNYLSGRYISSSEAAWRTFGFKIHNDYPPVMHLSVHEEDGQNVYFTSNSSVETVLTTKKTTLLGFFDLCKVDEFARTLFYHEIPQYYVWENNQFRRRKKGDQVPSFPDLKRENILGRVYSVYPNSDRYYLRLLLHTIRGPTSHVFLRTVDGIIHPTYKSACLALGLLEDDKLWDAAIEEASSSDSPKKLRTLFATILVFCNVSDPLNLWQKYKIKFSEDIARRFQIDGQAQNSQFVSDAIDDECLISIQELLVSMAGKSLSSYGLPVPSTGCQRQINIDYVRETSYDVTMLDNIIKEFESEKNHDQEIAAATILKSIENKEEGIHFLNASGGTGKTRTINYLLSKVRRNGGIAIAVASSGIAATLLQGGRTAHSTFKLPLDLNSSETVSCNLSKQSNMACVLRDCELVVWDECAMSHKEAMEAVHKLLQDIRGNKKVMGGVTFLLAGDFRQTLPVIPRGTQADEIKSCLKRSYLWKNVKVLTLTENMRVKLLKQKNAAKFADLLLQVGNGTFAEDNGKISLNSDLCTTVSELNDLVEKIYYSKLKDISNETLLWFSERAILTTTNKTALEINNLVYEKFKSQEIHYYSIDTAVEEEDSIQYPTEFLNSLNPSGLPLHKLTLKVGAPVMLVRNLKPPQLCNGTRLKIIRLHKNVVEATILTGFGIGESVFIPRIPLISSDYTFQFKRLQFPLKTCLAMTINKSQGQTFKYVGVDLRNECFSHGQLYVACSRVSSPESLVILTHDGKTVNVVYKEVLNN